MIPDLCSRPEALCKSSSWQSLIKALIRWLAHGARLSHFKPETSSPTLWREWIKSWAQTWQPLVFDQGVGFGDICLKHTLCLESIRLPKPRQRDNTRSGSQFCYWLQSFACQDGMEARLVDLLHNIIQASEKPTANPSTCESWYSKDTETDPNTKTL